MVSTYTKYYTTQYGKVEFADTGQGKPVFIAHGVTGGVQQGLSIASSYFGEGFRFIIVSRMGYGGSELPEMSTVEIQCYIYRTLLEFLKIDKVILYGNSAGGTSVMKFADLYPEYCRGLILQSSNMPEKDVMAPPPRFASKLIFTNNWLYKRVIKTFGIQMFVKGFIAEDSYQKLSSAQRHEIVEKYLLASLPVAEKAEGILFDMYESNPSINSVGFFKEQHGIPTLIIHGRDDKGIPYTAIENLKPYFSKLEVLLLNGGGHFLYGQDAIVKDAIICFVKQL